MAFPQYWQAVMQTTLTLVGSGRYSLRTSDLAVEVRCRGNLVLHAFPIVESKSLVLGRSAGTYAVIQPSSRAGGRIGRYVGLLAVCLCSAGARDERPLMPRGVIRDRRRTSYLRR